MSIEPEILFTGNRSIHFYFQFDFYQYLSHRERRIWDSTSTLDLKKRLWLEKRARKRLFSDYLFPVDEYNRFVDNNLKYDLLRQVPVANSFNFYTKKYVTWLSRDYLFVHPGEIIRKSTIPPFRQDLHDLLDKKVADQVKIKQLQQM